MLEHRATSQEWGTNDFLDAVDKILDFPSGFGPEFILELDAGILFLVSGSCKGCVNLHCIEIAIHHYISLQGAAIA